MPTRIVIDPAWPAHVDAAIAVMLGKVAAAVAEDARRFAPVDTGRLRASIAPELPEGHTARVRAAADYAGYVELGTRHMAPEPYLRPALLRKRVV